jgi:hypothetical protein
MGIASARMLTRLAGICLLRYQKRGPFSERENGSSLFWSDTC